MALNRKPPLVERVRGARIYTCEWTADASELQQRMFGLFAQVLADVGVDGDRLAMLAGGHLATDVLAQRVTVAVRVR